ncbi:MAG TPA: hypothetical protein VN253_28845 [Kofleriaceae bacterium]|nr:hypothetical protein [Kofleriaceae bacterium]
MVRHPREIACVLLACCIALPACGGGGKKSPKQPIVKDDGKKPPPPPETEEDREKKREAAARQIVPEGSNCLPATLKSSSAPRLDLAAVEGDAVVCAVDAERDRLLGPVACWKVDVLASGLTYQKAAPLPGRGFAVKVDDRCARGYCLPKDAKGDAKIAHMVWSPDGAKVAVNFGDELHVYDAASKAHERSFTIRGEKGVTGDPVALTWVGDSIFVEASDGGASTPVWLFKAADGAPGGAIESIGKPAKPLSTHGGSLVVLDKNRIAISEQGFSAVTTYEVDSGKRSKLVRKLPKSPCKQEETDAYWTDALDKVGAKCKEHMEKNFQHLIGADGVAGKKNLLVLLRAPRIGELAVMDVKTLAETRAIKLPWCDSGAEGPEEKEKASK